MIKRNVEDLNLDKMPAVVLETAYEMAEKICRDPDYRMCVAFMIMAYEGVDFYTEVANLYELGEGVPNEANEIADFYSEVFMSLVVAHMPAGSKEE